ncbi:MAG: hypothetical protein RIQ79_1936 [Verrucomicrobiota bacterium]
MSSSAEVLPLNPTPMCDQAASVPSAARRAPQQLPRLNSAWYQGTALVLWTHPLRDRETGWLDTGFHARFRELLTHTCARHQISCPAYVLMPDHLHLVWLGISPGTNQLLATKFLREHLAPMLSPHRLQPRPTTTSCAMKPAPGVPWQAPAITSLLIQNERNSSKTGRPGRTSVR